MKKIILLTTLILSFCLIFSLVVSAKGSFDGFVEDTNVRKVSYKDGMTLNGFGLPYYDFVLISSPVQGTTSYSVTQSLAIIDLNAVIDALDNDTFKNSTLMAIGYLGIVPNQNSYMSYYYTSSSIETNFDSVSLIVNTIGDYIQSLHLKENRVINLQSQVDTLNSRIEELEQTNSDNEELIALFEQENARLFNELTQAQLELRDERERYNRLLSDFETFRMESEENYITGFNDGLSESNVLLAGFKEIANTPFTFFSTVLDFELFGVNFFSMLKFILSVLIIGFAVKLFL